MPPSRYTDQEFIQFLRTDIGPMEEELGWTEDSPQYTEAINDTLLALGKDSLSQLVASDIPAVRAVGRLSIWRSVVRNLSNRPTIEAEGVVLNSRQLYEMAERTVASLAYEVQQELGCGVAIVEPVVFQDPYSEETLL